MITLPYTANVSQNVRNKFSKLCKSFCEENFNIEIVFNPFKTKTYFSY